MENVIIEENKNNIVVKHQDLVRNARYRLSDTALKTLSLLISMIKVDDTEFTQYVIKLSDFKELTCANSKEVAKYVDKMTTDLMSKPFWVGNAKLNWVTIARYEKGDNVVIFEIHRELKPYLLALKKNFLKYNIANILALKSGYIIRLYEICKDYYNETAYYNKVVSCSFVIKIEKLRELFEIPSSYAYKDIRVNILDKAVEQFKAKTDIRIEYSVKKIGRRVDEIVITVTKNSQGSNNFLRTRADFIRYMRKNYVNKDVLGMTDKYTKEKYMLSIDQKGKLYAKTGTQHNSKRSNELWNELYERAKDGKLLCLKQGQFEF